MQAFLVAGLLLAGANPLPEGKSAVEFQFGNVPLKVFTYKPKQYTEGPMILVFHGVLRNAEEYRDDSIEMGDRFNALIVAPLFDAQTFPKIKYQFGGIVVDSKAAAPGDWTGEYVNRIAKAVREREGRPDLPMYLIGHSGGGQFLIRMSGFIKTDAKRIVVANAGTLLFPTRQAAYPFGFGELPDLFQTDEWLKVYLAQPLTIYVGDKDVERDEYLDDSPAADAQGRFRFERGTNAYLAARKLATERKWPFNWKIVVAEGVEHDHTKMFNHPNCSAALELEERK